MNTRHDCDCDCDNSNDIIDHIYTGDEIIPWTLDYPGLFRPNARPHKESNSSGSFSKRNWSIKFHVFLSKAFRIARWLPLASIAVLFLISLILKIF